MLTACGTTTENQDKGISEDSHYPVELVNYTKADGGSEWQEKTQIYPEEPKRVLANTRPAAELMLHLGLKDRIAGVGATFGKPDDSVSEEFDTLNALGEDYINKETALSVDPDLIYGRGGLFENQDWGNGTVDALNEMGIPTYVLETSLPDATYDTVYDDIDNLAQIFNVKEAGEAFKKELQDRQAALAESIATVDGSHTFAYLHMSDPTDVTVYSAYGESFFNHSFELINLENIFKDVQGDVSKETLIEADPDIIIVPDWSTYEEGVTSDDMVNGVLNGPQLSSMQAVKNKQVYAVDYNYMFSYGYQTLTGMELLADEIYGPAESK